MEPLLMLLVLYVVLAPVIALPLYNTMIFYPSRYPEGFWEVDSVNGIKLDDVYIQTQNGSTLHAWYFENPGAETTVLVSHGNAGNITYRVGLISLILAAGASVLVYDYRGYGKSKGHPSLKGICQDGLAAYRWLLDEKGLKPGNIVHLGESLGSGVACHVAERQPCGGIILQSPFSSLAKIARQVLPHLHLYPAWTLPEPRLDNISSLKSPHAPLLIIHGRRDTLIPPLHSREIFRQAAEPKQLIILPEAGHNDIYSVNSDTYKASLQAFLARLSDTRSQ